MGRLRITGIKYSDLSKGVVRGAKCILLHDKLYLRVRAAREIMLIDEMN